MIPLRDNIPSRTTPWVTYLIVGVTLLVFLAQLRQPPNQPSLAEQYGMVPARLRHPDAELTIPDIRQIQTPFGVRLERVERPLAPAAVTPLATMFTCIFLHGSWMHFLGNMWFLFIFGDNVEDRFGHVTYLLFYVACGIAASAAHFLWNVDSTIPTIGASGAVAGVMGAYFVLYPRAMVLSVIPLFILFPVVVLPATIFLGIWFLMQFFQGAFSVAAASNVAWWAHVGGFLAGAFVARVMGNTHHLQPPPGGPRPGTDHVTVYTPRSYRNQYRDPY